MLLSYARARCAHARVTRARVRARARAEQNALPGKRAIGKNPDLRFFDLNTRAEIAKNRCFEKMFYSYKVFAKKTWSEKNPKNRQKCKNRFFLLVNLSKKWVKTFEG